MNAPAAARTHRPAAGGRRRGAGPHRPRRRIVREVTASLWDVPTRLAGMDLAGVSHQVISPVPVTMEYAAEPEAGAAYSRNQNDAIAAACARSGGRLVGPGCLPLHDARAAVAELDRCRAAGPAGMEIGTRVGGRDLDDPSLGPVLDACAATGTPPFVHPVDEGRAVLRRAGQPYELGLGMLTDTAIAASALVFGGVLERLPGLRVALAHGCGAFPWTYPPQADAPMTRPTTHAGCDPGSRRSEQDQSRRMLRTSQAPPPTAVRPPNSREPTASSMTPIASRVVAPASWASSATLIARSFGGGAPIIPRGGSPGTVPLSALGHNPPALLPSDQQKR